MSPDSLKLNSFSCAIGPALVGLFVPNIFGSQWYYVDFPA